MAKLNKTELQAALDSLPGWTFENEKLHREYAFADFVHAFGFMATSAIAIATSVRPTHRPAANTTTRCNAFATTC